jgi:Polyketide synthase dehydratase N-terminal domain
MVTRVLVQIPVRPWFADHRFNGKVIFPAVETMLLLAETAVGISPDVSVQTMADARFLKLLEIPKDAKLLDVLIEYEQKADGMECTLLSKMQFKKISRIREHAALYFCNTSEKIPAVARVKEEGGGARIDAARIYRELVPFGNTYRSIVGEVHLLKNTAVARLQATKVAGQQRMETVLGSPFPLDGAMHVACVLGQCLADFVPFPVAFRKRVIHSPTVAGGSYLTTVQLISQTANELVFDLSIFDREGAPCETVKGLTMRDVTAGLIKPPPGLPRLTAFP